MILLVFFGYLILFIGAVLVLVAAFREHVLWGLVCLFVPLATLIFVVSHWEKARTGFLLQILGFLLALAGIVLTGGVPSLQGPGP